MNATTDAVQDAAQETAPLILVPAGHIAVKENYSFRRFEDTPANRAKQLPTTTADHNIAVTVEDEKDEEGKPTGKKLFKRTTESYSLIVPTPAHLGVTVDTADHESVKQARAFQSMIVEAVSSVARSLVNVGKLVTPDNCNWAIAVTQLVDRLDANAGSGAQFDKDFLEDVADKFGAYMIAIGKSIDGVEVMKKLIKGRFNPLAVRKYINGLPTINNYLEQWLLEGCNADEQAQFADCVVYLSECIDKALKPVEVDTATLFG